jgi:cardiolipin synthase
VDGQIAWTGGRNFTRSGFFKHHDLSFTLTGPLVAELEQRFDDYWKTQGGALDHPAKWRLAASPPGGHCPGGIWMEEGGPPPNAFGRLVYTEPGDYQLARALYRAVDQARHHIFVENVYFCDSRLVYKLARARRRGVDVRVVLTFTSTDERINGANRVVANRLLRAGVRVYVYPIMTHVKAAAVDGGWAYLGTGNFDPLSLRHNHELGLTVSAGPFLTEIEERVFRADFRPEWELTRPVPVTCGDYLKELLASLAL